MLNRSIFLKFLFTASLLVVFSITAFADTIRMKDGSTIKGKIIGFKDQQFIIAIGEDARGKKKRITVNADDIDSIAFDGVNPTVVESKPAGDLPVSGPKTDPVSKPVSKQPVFITVNPGMKVLSDNTANGWTNSGYVVRRGQRVRITAKGNISLGTGKFTKPDGDPSLTDKNNKLMQQSPTGALIAVIGDDNDEFIFIGMHAEFIAQRDGTLFLGINEFNLDDNSGAFEVVVEAEVDNLDSPQP